MVKTLKRKFGGITRKLGKAVYNRSRRYGPKKRIGTPNVMRLVNKVLNRKLETKMSTTTTVDGSQITHNNFVYLDTASTIFRLDSGTGDPMVGTGNRIGDEVTIKGINIKMMVELNERYSDVTFRFFLIRSAKGDSPTRDTIFKGQSGNKMLDGLNTERYTFLIKKTFKVRAPNSSTFGAQYVVETLGNSGIYQQGAADQTLTRATKIISVYIPGRKIAKGGVLKYENGSATQLKFFDYHTVLFAYSNFSTNQDQFNVGRVNDYLKTIYYTDA